MTVTEFFNKLNNGTTWSAGVAFKRAAPLPLDRYSVFSSKGEADTYASENAVAYPGQIIAVVEESATSVYYIDQAMVLKEVGKLPSGDGKTVAIDDDGIISLYGLDGELDEAKSYQPVYKNGALTWVEVSSTTVEGLQTLLETLQGEVDTLETDVAAIKGDHLTSADKAELEEEISAAKTEAVDEAVKTVLGETVNADFDTLQEVAEWIQSDTTNSAELINRVSAIEGDYLKNADKTELQGKIDELVAFVGTIPEGSTSTTVISYIQEVVDGLNIGDYAKASELTALANRVTTIENKLNTIEDGAQVNVIDSVDTEQFAIDDNKNLTLLEIAMSKVSGLEEALGKKVSTAEGQRLITEAEAEKLESLVIGEDGSVEISGTVSMSNVEGLADALARKVGVEDGKSLVDDTLISKLEEIENGAQENVIEIVKIGEAVLEVAEDKSVTIPTATSDSMGAVKGSAEIGVAEDGSLEVKSIDINKITQNTEDTLIINGGSSAT